jgi:hypothetical protein
MVCYGPRIGTIAVAGAVVYMLLHRVIGSILHIVGLVLQIALITCVAAAAAALMIWTVRRVRRRRAAAGACTTCRFRCQQSLILLPQPGPRALPPGHPRPRALPPRVPVAQTGDRPEARPLVLR